jgi:hypothetical protein
MTALLVETTESRMLLLQALQSLQRLADPVQISLVDCLQIKDINIRLHRIRQRFGYGECFTVWVLLANDPSQPEETRQHYRARMEAYIHEKLREAFRFAAQQTPSSSSPTEPAKR